MYAKTQTNYLSYSDTRDTTMIQNFLFEFIARRRLKRLVRMGLELGKNVFIGDDVIIDPSFPWLITIKDECTITDRVIILAHDASTKKYINKTKIKSVIIGEKSFIGVGSIILPGVTIGKNVIVGAGSVVTKDIPENSLVAGNPAKIIGNVDTYIKVHEANLSKKPTFGPGWTLDTGIADEDKQKMKEQIKNTIGYVI
jgi:maltose O-acetyltransferase